MGRQGAREHGARRDRWHGLRTWRRTLFRLLALYRPRQRAGDRENERPLDAHRPRKRDRDARQGLGKAGRAPDPRRPGVPAGTEGRSEEHTSELQSLMRISYAVCCLKKKTYERHSPLYTTMIQ